ncbi:hypothetical protein HBA54_17250 [Pelagibius litoralis]|uniref:Uncharacterized protein n=1 Tax=Pelagibius litoralis TaxID=374515 RepID=A0A967EZP2_9PROT|nr:hypothetical protein [Pelagibius litoralis]NIA70355.1 hypothetical protein [Pelagibius litoralis]
MSVEEVLGSPLWADELAFAALEHLQAGKLTLAQLRLLHRFLLHLEQRGKILVQTGHQDLADFGPLWRVEGLAKALSMLAPEVAALARPALKELRAEKWRKEKAVRKPVIRKSRRRLSLPPEAWPAAWRIALRTLEARAAEAKGDEIGHDDGPVYAISIVRSLTNIVGQLAKSNRDHGLGDVVSVGAVDVLLRSFRARETRPTTKLARTKELLVFAAELGAREDVLIFLRQLREGFEREAKLNRTRKEDVLLSFPYDLGDIYLKAMDLLAQAGETPAHQDAAFHARMDAALIGLSCNAPLRCGDLHRLRIGREIVRQEQSWRLRLEQKKNQQCYGVSAWPEVAEMLDALILDGRSPVALSQRLKELEGRYLFSWDGGLAAVDGQWPSKVWRRHFGVGEHYVRSLWCSYYAEEDPDNAWAASALVGHGSELTRQAYEVNVQRRKSMSTVQSLIQQLLPQCSETSLE